MVMLAESSGLGIDCLEKQATMHRMPLAPYLPPEVHRLIAQCMCTSDLPDYRLASKMLAEIGAELLFGTIPFHCSSASLGRINNIKQAEYLHKYCHTLAWDTNAWTISGVRDFHEWTRYFEAQAKVCCDEHRLFEVGKKLSRNDLINLAHNRQEWERYVTLSHNEKVAKDLGSGNVQRCFEGFKNLRKLRILNGDLARTHRGIEKMSDFVRLPEGPAGLYRGESLYQRYTYPHRHLQRPGGHALATIQRFRSVDWHLTKLRIDAVCFSVFAFGIGEVSSLQHLLSFHIRITHRFDYPSSETLHDSYSTTLGPRIRTARNIFRKHHLMKFLIQLPKLTSLKVDLSGHISGKDLVHRATTTLSDIFRESHIWPDLEKISLRQLDTSSEALLSLVGRHRSTLKVLKLDDVWFTPSDMTPPDILHSINDILQLERAKLSGEFGPTVGLHGPSWNLNDGNLALRAANFLVHGGTCPLDGTNENSFENRFSDLVKLDI